MKMLIKLGLTATLFVLFFFTTSSIHNKSQKDNDHPCSTGMFISATVSMPDCNYETGGELGSIHIITPQTDPDGEVIYKWSHDPSLIGRKAEGLAPGTYSVIILKNDQVRKATYILE